MFLKELKAEIENKWASLQEEDYKIGGWGASKAGPFSAASYMIIYVRHRRMLLEIFI